VSVFSHSRVAARLENAHGPFLPARRRRAGDRAGTYDTIVGEIEKRYGGCADIIAFPTSPDLEPRALREVVEAIQRIPSAFAGYAAGW